MELKEYAYVNQDALDFLKAQPDGSINLIVTSPPYNIGKEYETVTTLENYLAGMEPIIKEACRVVSDNGSVCWETGNYTDKRTRETYPLDLYFYPIFKRCGLTLRNRIIWHFSHGFHCWEKFSCRYETILWFTKTDDYTFNLDDVRIPSKQPGKRYWTGVKKGQLSGNPKGKNPEDIWEANIERLYDDWERLIWDVPNVKHGHPEKTEHPCQFPVELIERCVLALTNEDDVVYDPFAGVGSSMIAALKNGRRAIGTELVQKYIDIGLGRIEKLKNEELKTRPIYQRVYDGPTNGESYKYPTEWLEKRLGELDDTERALQDERCDVLAELESRKSAEQITFDA